MQTDGHGADDTTSGDVSTIDLATVDVVWITDRYGIVRGAVPDGVTAPSPFTAAPSVPVGTHGHDVVCFGRSAVVDGVVHCVPAVELTARPGPDATADLASRYAVYRDRVATAVARLGGFCAVDRSDPGFWTLTLFVPEATVATRAGTPQQWCSDVVALAAGAAG
jgi:hypothetical protein